MLKGLSILILANKVEDMERFNLVTVLQNILISFFSLALLKIYVSFGNCLFQVIGQQSMIILNILIDADEAVEPLVCGDQVFVCNL